MDIYFVMDFTKTMRDAKDALETASVQIAGAIKGLTPDFQIGFGSFSDKAMVPFSMEKSRYLTRKICPDNPRGNVLF